jgi:hypothetical protein
VVRAVVGVPRSAMRKRLSPGKTVHSEALVAEPLWECWFCKRNQRPEFGLYIHWLNYHGVMDKGQAEYSRVIHQQTIDHVVTVILRRIVFLEV